MWNRLKRIWTKASDAPGPESVGPELVPPEPEPEPEPHDPMLERLEAYDARAASSPDEAPSQLRALMLDAPTDARVLRRAAALMTHVGDDELAEAFDRASRTSADGPLTALGEAFLAMEDLPLALAFAEGAASRVRGPARPESLAVSAMALGRMGEHARLLERLDHCLPPGEEGPALTVRLRYALSALLLEDWERYGLVRGMLGEVGGWVEEVVERVEAFPWEEGERSTQRLVFALYGALAVDDLRGDHATEVTPFRLGRWMSVLAALAKETLPPETRPAWVGPRGEVLARWLGTLLPENAAIPLSARLPRQPVIVVLADDAELANLVEMGLGDEASTFPMFQAIKDPAEIGSPMADVVGVFRAGVTLPLGLLDAERAAERLTPRMLASRLQEEARVAGPDVEVSEVAQSGQGDLFSALDAPPETEVEPVEAAQETEPGVEPEFESLPNDPIDCFITLALERREVLAFVRTTPLGQRVTLDPATL
jgi:hypothetical protein